MAQYHFKFQADLEHWAPFMYRRHLTRDEAEDEAQIVCKVVAMLIAKHNVLIVASTPDQLPDESAPAYNLRKRNERILAVNPMYTDAD